MALRVLFYFITSILFLLLLAVVVSILAINVFRSDKQTYQNSAKHACKGAPRPLSVGAEQLLYQRLIDAIWRD